MRLFFASSVNNCASNNATMLDTGQLLGGFTGAMYTTGLQDLVTTYKCTGALATYYIGGMNSNFPNPSYHQHIFRSEFYTVDTNSGTEDDGAVDGQAPERDDRDPRAVERTSTARRPAAAGRRGKGARRRSAMDMAAASCVHRPRWPWAFFGIEGIDCRALCWLASKGHA